MDLSTTPALPARPAPGLAGDSACAGQMSRAIAMARVLCIMGIVYVHAWTGRNGADLNALNHTPQGMLRWALVELLARSSVPLLSMVSGWLVGPSLLRRGAGAFLAGKARSVLAPMVLWNGLAIVLVSGAAWAGWIYAPRPTSWGWTVNELFCLVRPDDINVQIPFLRDLFVCLVMAPLLVRCPDRVLGMVAAGALVWALAPAGVPVLQRPSILLFFVVGMLARRHGLAARMGAAPLALVGLPYGVMAGVKIWIEAAGLAADPHDPVLLAAIDLMMRAATALFFWALAWRLADGRLAGSRMAAGVLRVEPYMFLMFCAHLIMIWLGGPLIGQWTGPIGAPLYPLFLIGQPFLVLGASLLLGRGLMLVAPGAAAMLSGGRLARG
jgi:hypothetical protein